MRVYQYRVYPRMRSVLFKQPNGSTMTSNTLVVAPATVHTSDFARDLAATLPIVIIVKGLREIIAGQVSFAPSLLSSNGR